MAEIIRADGKSEHIDLSGGQDVFDDAVMSGVLFQDTCLHPDFMVNAEVNRLEDLKRFSMDLKVSCAFCGKPFRFIGLPMGLDLNGAAVSPDGTEGRFAIHPVGEPVPGLSDDAPAGFRIMQHPNKQ